MVKIDKEVMKIFKSLSEANDQIIKKEKNSFMPICALISKENIVTIMGMMFRNGAEKEHMRNAILKHISEQSIKAYILILDTKMTKMEPNKEREVKDVSMRTIYTPKGDYMEAIIYKDGEIIEKRDTKGMNFKSEWSLWGEHPDYTDPEVAKALNDYKKYKSEHKEIYGSLA
jgi:hypothetical protein